MSKRKQQRKLDKRIQHEENKFKELINDLLYGLDEYGVSFKIIENDKVEQAKETDSQFLKCPFAVEYSLKQSKNYCNKKFTGKMYLNENGDGFWSITNNGSSVDVDGPAWFFIEYSNFLEKEIKKLRELLISYKN